MFYFAGVTTCLLVVTALVWSVEWSKRWVKAVMLSAATVSVCLSLAITIYASKRDRCVASDAVTDRESIVRCVIGVGDGR
jgi:Na+-translocating ferredoxin:NAD+ oxidoreductase RnfA subunit